MAQTALPVLLLCPQQQLRLAGRLKSSNPGAGSEEAKCQEQQAEQCHEFPPLKESDREYFDGPEQFRALVSLEKFQVAAFCFSMLAMAGIALRGTNPWSGSWAPVLLLHGLQTSEAAGKRELKGRELALSCIPSPRAHTSHVSCGNWMHLPEELCGGRHYPPVINPAAINSLQ